MTELAQRFDFIGFSSKIKRTPQGFVRVPANLARVGVLEYKLRDGSTVRELRAPEEVFKKDSLATLSAAPITVDHKAGLIDPTNVQSTVGVLREKIDHDERFVKGELTVQRADAIQRVISKELCELSPGYTCRLDRTPGVWNGERYDQIQRDITYNHVALLPKGKGRQGAEVAIKMDADDEIDIAVERIDSAGEPVETIPKGETMKKLRITMDDVTYEIEVAEGLATTFESSFKKLQTERMDAAEKLSKVEGELTATKKERDETKTRLDAAEAPEAIEKAATARADLITKAKELSPEIKIDGKKAREIKLDALTACGFKGEDFEGKDDSYVDGVFTATKAPAKKVESGLRSVGGPVPRVDSTDPKEVDRYDSAAAHERMCERNRNAWNTQKEGN